MKNYCKRPPDNSARGWVSDPERVVKEAESVRLRAPYAWIAYTARDGNHPNDVLGGDVAQVRTDRCRNRVRRLRHLDVEGQCGDSLDLHVTRVQQGFGSDPTP